MLDLEDSGGGAVVPGETKKDPEGSSSALLPRLDSNQ